MHPSTIRLATAEDLPAVQRLVGDAALDLRSLAFGNGHRYSLVLDDVDGELAAAAVIRLAASEGTLELLAVKSRFRDSDIEKRMLGVAEALCDAFGCDRLVVPCAA